jgi:small subunit ribosomal protein S4
MLKGIRCETAKCPMERQWRNHPPGMHSWRRGKASNYGIRLREKQKVKRYYGLLERQFVLTFREAERSRGNTGEELLILLERRLSNVVWKLGFASSPRAARMLVTHGHVYVNGRRVNRPGYTVRTGDRIGVKDRESSKKMVREQLADRDARSVQPWLQLDAERLEGQVVALPGRDSVHIPVEEQLIVELCSR